MVVEQRWIAMFIPRYIGAQKLLINPNSMFNNPGRIRYFASSEFKSRLAASKINYFKRNEARINEQSDHYNQSKSQLWNFSPRITNTSELPTAQMSLSEYISHLRNYYKSSQRINLQELYLVIDRLEKEVNVIAIAAESGQTRLRSEDFQFLASCCTTSATPALRPVTLTMWAERIFNNVPKFGLPYDRSLINAMLNVYYQNRCYDRDSISRLVDIADKLPESSKSSSTLEYLLRLACQQGDMGTAWNYFEAIREDALPIRANVYHQLLYGFAKERNQSKYNEVVSAMSNASLPWTSSTYTAVMTAHAETGAIEDFFRTFHEADDKGIVFNDEQLLNCIFALAALDESYLQHIDKVLGRLRRLEHQQVTSIAQRLLAIDRPRAAFRIFATVAKQLRDKDDPLDIGNFLIEEMFVIHSPIQDIVDLCERLEEYGLNRRPFLNALNTAYVCQLEDEAVKIFSHLRSHNYEVRSQYLFPLLILKAKRGAMIEELVDAVWLWHQSLRSEDKSDRLFDDAAFGLWYWPWVEHAEKIRIRRTNSSAHPKQYLLHDLHATMDGLVKEGRRVKENQPVTSGNVLTGFVHHCLIKDYADVIREAVSKYPYVHIGVYKLHVALARFYQRTFDAQTLVCVLAAGGRDHDAEADVLGFRAGNGELLCNLLGLVSLESYVTLLEKMADVRLKIDPPAVRKIRNYWLNSIEKAGKEKSSSHQQLLHRLENSLHRLSRIHNLGTETIAKDG